MSAFSSLSCWNLDLEDSFGIVRKCPSYRIYEKKVEKKKRKENFEAKKLESGE